MPPAITNLPQSLTVTQGLSATFTVGASGSAPFTYQWSFNSANISGATASSYTRTNVQPTDAGTYSVVVSNSAGSATSSPPAILTVIAVPTPPGITTQPQSQTVSQTSNATFTVTATGSTPLSYQWLFNGAGLAGATASSYTVANAQTTNAGSYSVIITNCLRLGHQRDRHADGHPARPSSASNPSTSSPPSATASPSRSAFPRAPAPPTNGGRTGRAISGATQSSLTLASLSWGSAGTYSVVVTNSAGSQTSAGATLIVQQAAFTFFDGFESYSLGRLDNNFGGPNATTRIRGGA